MSNELELKFALPATYLPQLISLLPQLAQVQHQAEHALLNAYFDTADNWFRRHDMGLRSRLKNGCYEQTIKLSGQQHGALQMRPEYNVPCASVLPVLADFPPHIWPEKTDVTALQHQLTELFRTDFVRHSWQLDTRDGSRVELAYDAGCIGASGKQQPIAELELELLSGNGETLFSLARQLLNSLPLQAGWLSKAARGYLLRSGQPLSLPAPAADRNVTVTQPLTTLLSTLLSALQQAEACYPQQGTLALKVTAQYLQQLADTLKQTALDVLAAKAQQFAKHCAEGEPVFASTAYQLWLLDVSHYLYQQSGDGGQHDNG
ncbi:MAG: CYTH domain-containing protein [Chromatiaceae bacterium]|nr:CYTH domain-containing protein [Chromatiaceae bacterium]